jgi:hypothetical protein
MHQVELMTKVGPGISDVTPAYRNGTFLLYEAVDLQTGLVQEEYESQPK